MGVGNGKSDRSPQHRSDIFRLRIAESQRQHRLFALRQQLQIDDIRVDFARLDDIDRRDASDVRVPLVRSSPTSSLMPKGGR